MQIRYRDLELDLWLVRQGVSSGLLKQLGEYSFHSSYKEHIPLSAIIYLHRISDQTMAESPLKNIQMLANLCGQVAMPRVVIGTTMWSEVGDETGQRREGELKQKLLKDMIDNGCTVQRFGDSHSSAWDIIGKPLYDNPHVVLSNEIVDDKNRLNETTAGVRLNEELQRLIADQQEATRRLEEQVHSQDTKLVAELRTKKMDLDRKINGIATQLEQLKIPFGKKLKTLFRKGRRKSSKS